MRWKMAVVLMALAGTAAQAQAVECPKDCPSEEVVEPCSIFASGGRLDITLTVKSEEHCVPVWVKKDDKWTCTTMPMTLPTYVGYSCEFGSPRPFPGPTLRVTRGGTYRSGFRDKTVEVQGDRISVKLVNDLDPKGSPHECTPCDCSQTPKPQCCNQQQGTFKDEYPNCFHGNNATNLHFHGTHVSPQPPQDYVLLELLPGGSSPAGTAAHGRGQTVVGSYQYNIQRLPRDQPEGTHWYHPHKHGAAALQVGSGMAGALIIDGPFDEEVIRLLSGSLLERVLVIQQIHSLNFTSQTPVLPHPLVNGMAVPTITMNPGEIQRWRFVGATMEGSAQIRIDFNGPKDDTNVKARQMAMDGVQFAPENYERQPFLKQDILKFDLSPGNRADFLVQAPTVPGVYNITYDVFGRIEKSKSRKDLLALLEAIAPGAEEPPLLKVKVDPCPHCQPMDFPAPGKWPKMPEFLRDIKKEDVVKTRGLTFAMLDENGKPPEFAGTLPSKFYINDPKRPNENRQYRENCVDITTTLGTAEEWTITNNMDVNPFHVFHIHTNPFQVIQNGTKVLDPPYIWQDSITLPASTAGKVVIRQRYETFTGEYVLHCHFLGHEDRGMMLGVQTVCPNDPTKFGKAKLDGSPECVPGNFIDAAPQCANPLTDAVPTTSGHGH